MPSPKRQHDTVDSQTYTARLSKSQPTAASVLAEGKSDHSRSEAKGKPGGHPPHSVFHEVLRLHHLKLHEREEEDTVSL